MSSRSIVDRVLLFAAAVCTAGLVWQLTVLMTAKGSTPPLRKVDVVSATPAQPVESAPGPAPVSTVRVVYPDGGSPKMTGKAVDTPEGTPIALASQLAMNAAAAPSASPAAKPAPVALAPSPAAVSAAPAPAATAADTVPVAAAPAPGPVPADAVPAAPTTAVAAPSPPADDAGATPSAEEASTGAASTAAATPPRAAAPAHPRKVAALAPAASAETSSSRSTSAEAASAAKRGGLNINRASIEALNHLPGAGRIGQAIADHRPYRSIEDLLAKRVVRRSVYEQIKHQLATE